MAKGTHRGSVYKDGGAVRLLGGAETSRRGRAATTPRRQPPHGVGRQSPSLTPRRGRQSPSAIALFLSKKGKHVRREAAGLPRAARVSNACNRLGSVVLTRDELKQITNNFSIFLMTNYSAKGVLTNGDTIAVKRFALTITGLLDVQYETEAQHLMRLKHPNIVQLVGYCSETEMKLVRHNGTFVRAEQPERLLCLEYMPKGSLRGHLSDETSGLEWNTRYKIIKGICYGLHYLHEEWQVTPIIHMDLKPANILLDGNRVPKIADFGLSRIFGEEQTRTCTISCKGAPGYMAPEYIEKGVITKKFDIFSLGVIIIEIITGRKDYPTDETETTSQQYIDLVLNNWRHRPTKAQGYTSQDIDYRQIKKCIQIGLLCVKFDPVKRPTIKQIIKMLERSDEAYQKEREGLQATKQVQGTDHGEHTCVHRLVAAGQATAPAEHNPDADAHLQSLSDGLTVKTEGLPAAADPPQGCWSAATSENLYLSTSENWGLSPASSDSSDVASYLPFEWWGQAELQEVVVSATSNSNHVASYLPFECRGQAEFQEVVSALVAASAPTPPPAVDMLDLDLDIDVSIFFA